MSRIRGAVAAAVGAGALVFSLGAGTAGAVSGADEVTTSALPTCVESWGFVPATDDGDHDCLLGQGVSNNAVRSLQRSLYFCNGQDIAVDGIYGPNTAAAVRAVQRSAGIAVDGVYGPNTRDVMSFRIYSDCQDFNG
ncbi:Putative peptidoglycan binding domain-containing protein [Actinopolyspora alba]|uniref:Putative peptidoglycan binding domain-containing protein n=1 Tax=Actinopolyspora alba TaxID=673379 RepID=A0A1I1ZUB7_9ACTN|nr:peptidoglycan-binding domain-containing protein [Actinopolyspora alba]SFE35291.1 Putative peptidoglycan binding domain-containing protein [Actinopolyspora alba]